jgi:hypothetical protein
MNQIKAFKGSLSLVLPRTSIQVRMLKIEPLFKKELAIYQLKIRDRPFLRDGENSQVRGLEGQRR